MPSSGIKRDNSTHRQKVQLRLAALHELSTLGVEPVVMETHGGFGKLYAHCYASIARGVVFEQNEIKTKKLLEQRGEKWAVYEAECEGVLREGAGAQVPVNYLDVDPYGDPWPIIDAFLDSRRTPDTLMIVVNDGLRQRARRGHSWHTETLRPKVLKYGNSAIFRKYLDICQELMEERGAAKGYKLAGWTGYIVPCNEQVCHYAALLVRGQ